MAWFPTLHLCVALATVVPSLGTPVMLHAQTPHPQDTTADTTVDSGGNSGVNTTVAPPGIDSALLATPGGKLIAAMHARYATRWFKTMSAVQTTTQRRPDGATSTTIWYQSVSLPGYLRIDIGDPTLGNGALYTPDSVYRLRDGQIMLATNKSNELMPLMLDVFVVPPRRTIAKVKAMGVNLSVAHNDFWHGRPVIVIGAPANNLSTPQFWIDRERLVLLRQIHPVAPGDSRLLDIQLSKYQKIGDSWLASVVEIYMNGVLTQHEVYSNVTLGVPLDRTLFDVRAWKAAKHWVGTDSTSAQRYRDDSASSSSSRKRQ